MPSIYAPDSVIDTGGSEENHSPPSLGKELIAFTLITAIVFLDFVLLVIFLFFTFYPIHFSRVLWKYCSSKSKVMVILDSFKFSYFVVFILIMTAGLIGIFIGVLI